MANQKLNKYHSGYDELRQVLAELKANLNTLKAFVMVVPYPITMWDSGGQLVFANEEAIKFHCIDLSPKKQVLWKDHVFNNAVLPDPESIINNGDVIIIPDSSETDDKVLTNLPEHFRYIETIVSPVTDTNNATEIILITHIDKSNIVKERIKNRQLSKELEELKITLKNVLKITEEERKLGQETVVLEVRKKILPYIERFTDDSKTKPDDINKIEAVFNSICSNYNQKAIPSGYNFTPTELKVCEMLQCGFSGKEIAQSLNISYATVHSHMSKIRKKLNITGTKINLQTYLIESYG